MDPFAPMMLPEMTPVYLGVGRVLVWAGICLALSGAFAFSFLTLVWVVAWWRGLLRARRLAGYYFVLMKWVGSPCREKAKYEQSVLDALDLAVSVYESDVVRRMPGHVAKRSAQTDRMYYSIITFARSLNASRIERLRETLPPATHEEIRSVNGHQYPGIN